jgi:D-amino peptidase
MKVLISVDIEGISGIANSREYEHFEFGRKWITEDTNAAVEGALEGGASQITVTDSHGRHNDNILFDQLHPLARLIRGGKNTPLYFLEGLSPETDLTLLVGWHDKLGGPGVLSHTFVHQELRAMYLNGQEVGEVELAAGLAGEFGVPIGLVTGDDVTCTNAQTLLGEVETACVKQALDRYAADCLPLTEARQLIKAKARRAVERQVEFTPYRFLPPYRLTWECADHNIARLLARLPGSELGEGNTVTFCHEQFRVIFDVIVLWRTLLRTATVPN